MLNVVTWKWGSKYSLDYVLKLKRGLDRGLAQDHSVACFSDDAGDRLLLSKAGVQWGLIEDTALIGRHCFCRLRMFDHAWQRRQGFVSGGIVGLDLDLIVTGSLDHLFDRPEQFVVWAGVNAKNHPCPYTASVMMLQPGAHPEVWQDFSVDAAEQLPHLDFPDDQGWLHHKIPGAARWQAGKLSGIWAAGKGGWPVDDQLPGGACMVAFPGRRDPSQFQHLQWVKENWR